MSQDPIPQPTFPTPTDLHEIQGDVILGIPKRFEDFLFFTIQDVASFKQGLKRLIPAITTTAQIQAMRRDIEDHKRRGDHGLIKIIGTNIAFTVGGLEKLGVTESTGDDENFGKGQRNQAQSLGDPGTVQENGEFDPAWLAAFKNAIHGVVLVGGDRKASVNEGIHHVQHLLGRSIHEVLRVAGNARPGKEKGHEHFGFLDGISVPGIPALTPLLPGQLEIRPGILICGQEGDDTTRPTWTKNGSFLVYRHLIQLVPEFNKFLREHPVQTNGFTPEEGSEFLGARMVGRWKSGAPIVLAPLKDDPALAADKQRNNAFDYDGVQDQSLCPFAAHVRKTNPRTDLGRDVVERFAIMRAGIAFGPEVSPDEAQSEKTDPSVNRGLAFVAYQSHIENGFAFIQRSWANNVNFRPQRGNVGHDPIIGQNGTPPRTRSMQGMDPDAADQPNRLTMDNDFVVSQGGEYFFVPSISALKTKLSI